MPQIDRGTNRWMDRYPRAESTSNGAALPPKLTIRSHACRSGWWPWWANPSPFSIPRSLARPSVRPSVLFKMVMVSCHVAASEGGGRGGMILLPILRVVRMSCMSVSANSILGLGSPILTRNALDGLCSVAISYKCGSAILFLVVDLTINSTLTDFGNICKQHRASFENKLGERVWAGASGVASLKESLHRLWPSPRRVSRRRQCGSRRRRKKGEKRR